MQGDVTTDLHNIIPRIDLEYLSRHLASPFLGDHDIPNDLSGVFARIELGNPTSSRLLHLLTFTSDEQFLIPPSSLQQLID
jgi:hypothetical protein